MARTWTETALTDECLADGHERDGGNQDDLIASVPFHGVQYRQVFAEHKLALAVDVFNVFDDQEALDEHPHFYANISGTMQPLYGPPMVMQKPRYVR